MHRKERNRRASREATDAPEGKKPMRLKRWNRRSAKEATDALEKKQSTRRKRSIRGPAKEKVRTFSIPAIIQVAPTFSFPGGSSSLKKEKALGIEKRIDLS